MISADRRFFLKISKKVVGPPECAHYTAKGKYSLECHSHLQLALLSQVSRVGGKEEVQSLNRIGIKMTAHGRGILGLRLTEC
jgi:hypothetical protein